MKIPAISIDEIEGLVEPDRVHKRLYTDSDIFELEMDRVFSKAWIFVCHESQIPEPGDFCSAQVARQSVLVVRHTDDSIKALYNRCPHKGTQLTTAASGHVRVFRCMYHAWSFDTDGSLKARPLADGYDGSRLETDNEDCNLRRIACVESYRGFVFVRIHTEGPELSTWLGKARTSIDNMVDRSPREYLR
ncbi:Rieske 2Fe-2S domain-containing protein [Kineobactrum salinum]|uniref:Rieske 2Fe-2S domain-containing protein n=1 Tax=Kineobactrum salinum TaxID=2708301 RepID=A0A6C0TYT6_9GAMM|nr:Rieske 2Fe-2S domain-containing protein [Kineobactrum salinum]QIB64936.1 Rieske 2Fe-2S domain-containing protein [Kineobactrum salinum]